MRIVVLAAAALVTAAAGPQALAPGLISTAANEYNLTTARDGSRVFARSEADFRNARIFVQQGTSAPEPIAFTDARWSDSDPHLSADGRELTFVSTRPLPDRPSSTDLNVWRSVRALEGGWSAPEPVAGANGAGPELGAEPHGERLRFVSVRRGGLGALDIYELADGQVRLLPAPVNSPGSHSDYTEHPSGRAAVFWSDRAGGLGGGDLYVVAIGPGPTGRR